MITDISELDKQIADLIAQKESILNSKRQEVLQQVKTMIAQYSLTAGELGFRTKGKLSGESGKAPPKYANPANPIQSWAGGKGARPKWVKEHLANGGSLDDLLISRL
jgi:DNA-binding protein H-NS